MPKSTRKPGPISRRRFLGTLGASTLAGLTFTGTVAGDHFDQQPDHVTLSYPESRLQDYQPRLVMQDDDRDALIGHFAWQARSPEYETDALVYWASYTHQDGVTDRDSHLGDHEPIYLFVDSETGEIETVVASVYHWLAGKTTAGSLPMTDQHPILKVIHPWHQYTHPRDSTAGAVDPVLYDLQNHFDEWLANGLESALAPGTVVNPWRMLARPHWWRRDTLGVFSTDALILSAERFIGLRQSGSLTR